MIRPTLNPRYQVYLTYCETVGVPPMSEEKWKLVSDGMGTIAAHNSDWAELSLYEKRLEVSRRNLGRLSA